jgi:hypothetical protein
MVLILLQMFIAILDGSYKELKEEDKKAKVGETGEEVLTLL